MITNIIFTIAIMILTLFYGVFGGFEWHLPSSFQTGLTAYFTLMHRLHDIFPFLDDLFMVLSIIVVALGIKYTVRILLWVFAHIPFFGKHVPMPGEHNTLDLSRGKHKFKISQSGKDMRDIF